MSRLRFRVSSGSVALTAATPMTVLQLTAPTNQRVILSQLSVSFDGASGGATPVEVKLVRQTTAGTMTSSPPSPVLVNKGLTETIQTAITWKATAEPTSGDVLDVRTIPAYHGTFDILYPFSQEIEIQGGGRLGIVCNAPAGVNVHVNVQCEE